MISYRIDPARRLVIVTGTGMLSGEAISASQAELRMAPGFDPSYALLVDFRTASFAAIEPGHVRRHAAEDPIDPASPRAVVVRHDSDRGMVRMLEVYRELNNHTGPVRAFTDMAEALAWIDSVRDS